MCSKERGNADGGIKETKVVEHSIDLECTLAVNNEHHSALGL